MKTLQVTPEGPSTPVPGKHSLSVLVIDDNREGARTLELLLTSFGHSIRLAHTGPTGLQKAREERPDVVLCDLNLPGMDGYEVAKAFRGDPALANIHLLALTGCTDGDNDARSFAAGFELHLVKPV